MKNILFFLLILSIAKGIGQNKQVLYNFAELPQTLLSNPGTEVKYKSHFGVPLFSGFSMDFGSSGFVLTDLFSIDNNNINDKISSVLNNLTTKDFVKFNSQREIITAGFRVDDAYVSFGFYKEIDAIVYYPKDVITLLNEGNAAYLNKRFRFSQLLYKADIVGVIHAGITKKVSKKLTMGGRFKIYSSALNAESIGNTGTFTTAEGTDNIYKHYLNNININIKSSGLVGVDDEFIDQPSAYLNNTFLGDNLGVGFDVGATYHITPQLEFSGSILDFGFVHHKKNIKNFTAVGSFFTEGINLQYDSNNPKNYWQELSDNFEEQIPANGNGDSYISWRPTKLNAAMKYSFGEKRSEICYDDTYKIFYTDAVGVQLYSVFRPLSPQLAFTAFYQKSITNKFHTKLTYTADDLSYHNIGAGFSAQYGKVNLYGMLDNILEYTNLSSANSLSFQLGMNVIFN